MPTFPYPNQRYTTNLGLSLFGMDEVLADNMNLIDAAYGAGSSVNVNGSLVTDPNFNGTTPAAPAGKSNVIWQVDINGNVSAYATASSSAAGSDTQVQYNKSGAFGADSSLIWNYTSSQLFIGGVSPTTSAALTIIGASAGSAAAASPLEMHSSYANGINMYTHSSTAFRAPAMTFARSNGTQSSPTAVTGAGELGYITFNGYDGTVYAGGAQIVCQTGTAWSTGVHSSTIYINACPAQSTSLNEVLRINSNTDNGGDINGNISRLNWYVNTINEVTSAVQFLGFIEGDGTLGGTTAFSNPTAGSLLLGNGSANDFSGSLKLTGLNNVGTYTDSTGAVGTSGQLLSSTVTGTAWVPASTGFVNPMTTLGDIIYENATPAAARLAGNTTTTKEYLSQTGNGTISAAPAWAQIAVTDLSNIAGGTVLGNTGTTAGTVAATIAPVLGIPGTSTGSIAIASSTASGKYTITVPANAATPTLTLPTASNVLAGQFAGDNVLYSNTPVGATAAGTLALPTLSTQTANYVFAGPTSGAAAAPTFRALVAADIPNAANLPLWSNLQNAAGALTLANGNNTTTFNQTSNVVWLWANTTTATSGTTNASPLLELVANYWTGAASATDTWSIGSSLASGTNGASTLSITHSGSTGAAKVSVPVIATTVTGSATACAVQVNIVNSGFFGSGGGNGLHCSTGGTEIWQAVTSSPSNSLMIPGTVVLGFALNAGSNCDISLSRPAAGVLAIGNGTTANNVCTILSTVYGFGSTATATAADSGISRLGAASLAIGNGTASDTTGKLSFGTVAKYNGTATVRNGVAAEYASSDLTAQSAAITATTLLSAPQTGMYKVSWSATITTASDISSVLGGTNGFQVIYTSPTDSVAKTTVPGNSVTSSANTTGTAVGGVEVIYAKTGTNVQFSYGYTDSHTSTAMAYELHVTLESL